MDTMTLQNIQLLEEDYRLSSIAKDLCQSTQCLQLKTAIQQQTRNKTYVEEDDDVPLSRYILGQSGQDKKKPSQHRKVHQLTTDITLEDEENDDDLLPISILQGTKTKELHQCLSAAEKYKHSVLSQHPELKSALTRTPTADADRDLRRLSQYHCKESDDDDDDNIPLFQTYHALSQKTTT